MQMLTDDIAYQILPETLIAEARITVSSRQEIKEQLQELKKSLSDKRICGPGFCVFNFITDAREGFDVNLGFPVDGCSPEEFDRYRIFNRPAMEVLSLDCTLDHLAEGYANLYQFAADSGFISDEFNMEIYPEGLDSTDPKITACFVNHNWKQLFEKNIQRVLGLSQADHILDTLPAVPLEASFQDRSDWAVDAVRHLACAASEEQTYDVVSSCAHVFPKQLIEQLRETYLIKWNETLDMLQAVDAVIQQMADSPAWGETPNREGQIIYTSKRPKDPMAFKAAKTDLEKKKAACFCPLIQNRLDQDLPVEFCHCGAGWYRQQWEGILGVPLTIKIHQSLVKGDDKCCFAIHLPEFE